MIEEKERQKMIKTCHIVGALKEREGVRTIIAEPYETTNVSVKGPAIILIVTD